MRKRKQAYPPITQNEKAFNIHSRLQQTTKSDQRIVNSGPCQYLKAAQSMTIQ